MSTKPGQTKRPLASITRSAGSSTRPTCGDPAARDADVGAVPGIAGAVDHTAASDQDVEHAENLLLVVG